MARAFLAFGGICLFPAWLTVLTSWSSPRLKTVIVIAGVIRRLSFFWGITQLTYGRGLGPEEAEEKMTERPGGAAEISRGPTSPRVPPPVLAIKRPSPRMVRWIRAWAIRHEILRVGDPASGQGVNRLLGGPGAALVNSLAPG